MRNWIVVAFSDEEMAYGGLRALKELHAEAASPSTAALSFGAAPKDRFRSRKSRARFPPVRVLPRARNVST